MNASTLTPENTSLLWKSSLPFLCVFQRKCNPEIFSPVSCIITKDKECENSALIFLQCQLISQIICFYF